MQPDHTELLARFEATVTELVNALNNGGSSPSRSNSASPRPAVRARAAHAQVETDTTGVPTEEITLEALSAPGDAIENIELAPIPDDTGVVADDARDGGGGATPGAVAGLPETTDEEIDADLLDVFHEEAVDILTAVEESLTRWRVKRDNLAAVLDLKRALHTLKGGAPWPVP